MINPPEQILRLIIVSRSNLDANVPIGVLVPANNPQAGSASACWEPGIGAVARAMGAVPFICGGINHPDIVSTCFLCRRGTGAKIPHQHSGWSDSCDNADGNQKPGSFRDRRMPLHNKKPAGNSQTKHARRKRQGQTQFPQSEIRRYSAKTSAGRYGHRQQSRHCKRRKQTNKPRNELQSTH